MFQLIFPVNCQILEMADEERHQDVEVYFQ